MRFECRTGYAPIVLSFVASEPECATLTVQIAQSLAPPRFVVIVSGAVPIEEQLN